MTRYVTRALFREIEERLTPRDLAVLRRVSDLRFVTGAQLARMDFMDGDEMTSMRSARRALLRLVKLELLARLSRAVGGVRAGSAGFVYYLAPAGQRLAMERGWQPERRRRRSLAPSQLFLKHTLQVAELHTQLREHDRSRRFELLELTSEPACWREFAGAGGQRDTLKPDSYARLGVGEYEDSYFFEVDRGTEGSRAVERQLERYLAYQASGAEQQSRGVFPRVLWLVPSQERAAQIRACIERTAGPAPELFAVALFGDLMAVLDPEGAEGNGRILSEVVKNNWEEKS